MDRPEERLALIEVYERDGRPGRTIDIGGWPLTIGRALSQHVVIDDPHIAAAHARIAPDALGRLVLTVLDSRNGVAVDGRRHAAGEESVLPDAGATLQLGATRLRLRLPAETLAPERPLTVSGGSPLPWVALLALLMAGGVWIGLDPGADLTAWLPLLVGAPVALAGWCGLWALMSKLFQHRFDFGGHLRIALPWLLAIEAVELLLPQLAAALGWPALWQLQGPVQVLLLALWVRAHLVHVLPQHVRAVTATVALVAVAGSAISLAFIQRSTDRMTRASYMSTLPLPALRLGSGVPPRTLVQDMGKLRQPLQERVKKAADEEGADDNADPTD